MIDKLNNFLDKIFTNVFDKYMPITFTFLFLVTFIIPIIVLIWRGNV